MHTDPLSVLYQRKVNKARAAIEQSATARSIMRTLQRGSLKHQQIIDSRRSTGSALFFFLLYCLFYRWSSWK